MKANELRIGNLVATKFGKVKIIDAIHGEGTEHYKYPGSRGIEFIETTDIKCSSDYNPIPLTEELLFKFGFKKYKKQSTFCNPEYRKKLRNSWNSYICFYFVDGWELPYSCNIKELPSDVYDIRKNHSSFPVQNLKINYVHQLQNLYFALTGEELEIKL